LLFPGKKNAAVYFFYRLKTGKIHHSNLIAKTRRTRRGEREEKTNYNLEGNREN
jgi:hypothetical protein